MVEEEGGRGGGAAAEKIWHHGGSKDLWESKERIRRAEVPLGQDSPMCFKLDAHCWSQLVTAASKKDQISACIDDKLTKHC